MSLACLDLKPRKTYKELGIPVVQYLSCSTAAGNTSVSTFLPYSMLKSSVVDKTAETLLIIMSGSEHCKFNYIMKTLTMEAPLQFIVLSRKPKTQ